jgi:hypothetical protein
MDVSTNELMSSKNIKELIRELQSSYGEACDGRFPYEGSRNLLREGGGSYEGLIPDLDVYFSTIAGYCSWGEKILKWPQEKIVEAQNRIAASFFEKHPQYKPLEVAITETKTPDLFAQMVSHEKMRTRLLELLDRLSIERV